MSSAAVDRHCRRLGTSERACPGNMNLVVCRALHAQETANSLLQVADKPDDAAGSQAVVRRRIKRKRSEVDAEVYTQLVQYQSRTVGEMRGRQEACNALRNCISNLTCCAWCDGL